jgi:hypothetical protein
MRLSILLLFLASTICGCVTYRPVYYKLSVAGDSASGPVTFDAYINGLANWNGTNSYPCNSNQTDPQNVLVNYSYCEFNLGLRKTVSAAGEARYELHLVHVANPDDYGTFDILSGHSLVLTVDGQTMDFVNNSDVSGAYYDVTANQLDAIISAKMVLVTIIGKDKTVTQYFGPENQRFFQNFINDPGGNRSAKPTPLSYSELRDNVQILIPPSPVEQQYLDQVNQFPLQFTVPKTKAKDSWGRAQSFIAQYSSMKIQTVTGYVIQTFNPTETGNFGYTVTKTPADQNVQFTITCIYADDGDSDDANLNAHILAYYMSTGTLNEKFIEQ